MNSSLLVKLNSTLSLSLRVQDFYNTFILPSILFGGLILNSLSLVVILKIKHKKIVHNQNVSISKNLFDYMLCNEIIDLIICIIGIFVPLIRGGVYFELGYSFLAKIYEQYFFFYLGNSCILWSSLLEVSFTWSRLKSFDVKNKNNNRQIISNKLKYLLFLIIALVVSLPNYVISRQINPIGILIGKNSFILYSVSNNYIGNSIYGQIILFIWTLFRGIFIYIIIFVLNIIIAFKFNKHMINKDEVTNNQSSTKQIKRKEKENRITKMVLVISTFYLIAHFPHSLTPIIFFIGINSSIYSTVVLVTNTLLFISHSSFFFVYFFYNSKFRKTFFLLFFTSNSINSNESARQDSSSYLRSTTRKTVNKEN